MFHMIATVNHMQSLRSQIHVYNTDDGWAKQIKKDKNWTAVNASWQRNLSTLQRFTSPALGY